MFKHFLEVFDNVISEAKKSDHVVKSENKILHDIIEDYIKKNQLIVSNIELLTCKEKTKHMSYTIYGDFMFYHANNIANLLAKENIYTTLYTNERNKSFSIVVDNERLVFLYDIRKNMFDAINPVLINGINMYPHELEIIELHHKLYLPNHYSDWETLLEQEPILFLEMEKRKKIFGGSITTNALIESQQDDILSLDDIFNKQTFQKKLSDDNSVNEEGNSNSLIVPARHRNYTNNVNDYGDIKSSDDDNIAHAQGGNTSNKINNNIIFNWLKERDDYVLIGINAYNKLVNNSAWKHHQKIQVIAISPKKFASEFSNLIEQNFGIKTIEKTHNVQLLTDPCLTKTVVGIKNAGRISYLLDIYNSSCYELIPYTVFSNMRIGTRYVLQRFLLINMWFLRVLCQMSIISKKHLKHNILIVMKTIRNVRKLPIKGPNSVLYFGVHIDFVIGQKKRRRLAQDNIRPYRPESYRYFNGQYRQITIPSKKELSREEIL